MTFLLRLGAVSGVLCGVLTAIPAAVEAGTGETAATSFVLGFAPAFGPALLTAVYLRQPGDRLSAVGYAVNLVGLVLFGGAAFTLNLALFYLDQPVVEDLLSGPTRVALLASAAVFVVGTVLFGASMIRARVVPRIPAWGYPIALSVFALAAPLPDTPLTSALHVVVGIILVWLSIAVWPARVVPDVPAMSAVP